MTSLQCPARIFLARHGEAEYETALVTDDGGCLTTRGREQSRALADRLRGERIARVWCSPLARAVQTAEIAAAALGVDVVVREGLRESGGGQLGGAAVDARAPIPEGEDAVAGVVERVQAVLREVADAHPGEAVLVVGHRSTLLAALPGLVGRPRSSTDDIEPPDVGHVTLEADADGWRLVRWDVGHDEVRLS